MHWIFCHCNSCFFWWQCWEFCALQKECECVGDSFLFGGLGDAFVTAMVFKCGAHTPPIIAMSLPWCAIFGYFKGILAYIRTLICAIWLIFYDGTYKAIVCDQVSFVLPFLRLSGHKTIFYCHYPDKLLAGSRRSILKKIYRFFIDSLE